MSEKYSLWHYVKSYRFNSIFIKNLLFILLIVIIPLAGIGMAIYRYSTEVMDQEVRAANLNALNRVRDMVDMLVNEVDVLTIKIASDTDVDDFARTPRPDLPRYDYLKLMEDIRKNISIYNIASEYVQSIYVYSEKANFVISSLTGGIKKEIMSDNFWYDEYIKNKEHSSFWVTAREGIQPEPNPAAGKNYIISTFRTIPMLNGEKYGVVVVNLDEAKMGRWISGINNRGYEDLYIVDKDNNIIFNLNPDLINKNVRNVGKLKDISLEEYDYPTVKRAGGVQDVISVVKSRHNEWKFISVIPLPQYQEKIETLRKNMVLYIMLGIAVAIVFAFITSIRVFEPIKDIIALMKNPGDWASRQEKAGTDKLNEIKYIASNIIKTYDLQAKTEEELAQRSSLLKKAQSVALQSQINPHFLYNTLDTINWNVMNLAGRDNQASRIIIALSELLRISLETSNNLLNIETEIKHAKLYLEIQKARFKEKFDVVWDVDEDILKYKITKITLQPLLENAISHGIKPKDVNGIITVSGKAKDDLVIFEISDNGVGMAREEAERINIEMDNDFIKEDANIGLRNVNQRIKLTFGDKYGLAVFSALKDGTTVKILLPKME